MQFGGTIFTLPSTVKQHRADIVLSLSDPEKLSPIDCAREVIEFYLGITLTKKSLLELYNYVSLKVFRKCRNRNLKTWFRD